MQLYQVSKILYTNIGNPSQVRMTVDFGNESKGTEKAEDDTHFI